MINMSQGGMRNMSNLYERLKPEYKAILDQQEIVYPNAIKALFEELENTHYVMDLKYGTAVSLSNFLGLRDYNFVTISDLF
jgi:hypothetical protein